MLRLGGKRCLSSMATAAPPPHSVYLAKLRRAFLLRAHPDRFRSHPPEVRRVQADLVQAIGERFASPDVLQYTLGGTGGADWSAAGLKKKTYHYVLEHKNGSLLQLSLELHDNVETVLKSMAQALESTGNVSLPKPPPRPTLQTDTSHSPLRHEIFEGEGRFHWAPSHPHGNARQVDHRYDINSIRGKDLIGFIENLDHDLVEERRAHRMDVTAVALVARRSYHFSAIDGTGLGWSSASLAILLRSLVALYEEHRSKLRVKSFYPLRLVLSSKDSGDPIDLYGGILYLNPASTPIQWLDYLMLISPDTLEQVRANQSRLQANLRHIQDAFGGVRFQKGHSCSPREYHQFMERLVRHHVNATTPTTIPPTTSTALTLERIVVTVESSQACRRAVVTKDGAIRVGASMDKPSVAAAISGCSHEASERVTREREMKKQCRETIDQAQWELGLQKVYPLKLVQTEQMLTCLLRLLAMEERQQLKQNLAGNSLGIAGSGHFCQLGDDGSVVIPWDWK